MADSFTPDADSFAPDAPPVGVTVRPIGQQPLSLGGLGQTMWETGKGFLKAAGRDAYGMIGSPGTSYGGGVFGRTATPISERITKPLENTNRSQEIGGYAERGATLLPLVGPAEALVSSIPSLGAIGEFLMPQRLSKRWQSAVARYEASQPTLIPGEHDPEAAARLNKQLLKFTPGREQYGPARPSYGRASRYSPVGQGPQAIPEPPAAGTATASAPAQDTELLNGIAKGMGGSSYAKLTPERQIAAQNVAKEMQSQVGAEPPNLTPPPEIPERYHEHLAELGGRVGTGEAMAKDLKVAQYLKNQNYTPEKWTALSDADKIKLMREADPKFRAQSGSRSRPMADFTKHVADTLRELYSK